MESLKQNRTNYVEDQIEKDKYLCRIYVDMKQINVWFMLIAGDMICRYEI